MSQPEDEPIVVDNPQFRIDLVNAEGAPSGGGPHNKLTRKCSSLKYLMVFDGAETAPCFFIELDAESIVELVLSGGGEKIAFANKTGTAVEVLPSRNTAFQRDATGTVYRLTQNPNRPIESFTCNGIDLISRKRITDAAPVRLSPAGRHVVTLLPGK